LALVNMTTFKCGKGSTHIDYLSGTQDMDILFSKVISYLKDNETQLYSNISYYARHNIIILLLFMLI